MGRGAAKRGEATSPAAAQRAQLVMTSVLLPLGLCDDERRRTLDLFEARVPGGGEGRGEDVSKQGLESGLGLGLG